MVSQYDVIVGMQLQENNVARQAAAQVNTILQEYRRLETANVGGPLSQQSINQFKTQLRQALQDAFRGSENFTNNLRGRDQRLVEQTTATPATPLLAQQLRLAQAELAADRVAQRSRIPLGTTQQGVKGYTDENQRTQARISAAGGIERANAGLERAINQQIREAAKDAQASQRNQEAKGRETLAIQRNTRAVQRDEEARRNAEARAIQSIIRRTRTMDAAADREARRQAGVNEADSLNFAPTYARPDQATNLGRAQSGVNAADRALEIATRKLDAERTSATRTATSVLAAERRFEQATTSAAAARDRVAAIQTRAAQVEANASTAQQRSGAGLGAQFALGFRGRDNDRSYAEQIGQAFKFSVFYGTAYKLLFGITQTFQQTLQEGIEFQTAVSELKLATQTAVGKNQEALDGLAESLGDQAVTAGFAPSEGVLAGARGVGLYGATQSSAAEQTRVAEISARVATRTAFNSGMQTQDVQTNIAAITNAFGLGAEGQFRVADLDAYFSRRFGVAAGGTIQAVAESANVGQAAGFNQEEINAIAGLLQGRTGQTASAVAGYMAQIFSRGGEGSLTNVASRYGIDPALTLAEQIKELSRVYQEGSPNEQNAIAAAFGRGKVQNAATVLLGGYGEVEDAARDVRGGAADGESDKAFDIRISNIGGQIQQTTATLKEFANQLGQTGVLSALGLFLVGIREGAEAVTNVLRLFNDLDAPIRAAIIGIGLLAAASRTGALATGVGALRGGAAGVGLFRGGVVPGGRLGIASAAGGVAPLASRAGIGIAAGAAGSALGSIVNPATLAIGGLLAIASLRAKSNELSGAIDSATGELNAGLGPGATPDQLTARSSALRAGAGDVDEAASGLLARIVGRGDAQQSADQLRAEAERLEALAGRIASNAENAPVQERQAFTAFDADSIDAGFQMISDSGGTARAQMEALAAAIRGGAEAAENAKQAFDPKVSAGELAGGAFGALLDATPDRLDLGFGRRQKDQSQDAFRRGTTESDVQAQLEKELSSLGSLGELDKGKADEIAGNLVRTAFENIDTSNMTASQIENLQRTYAESRDTFIGKVSDYLLGQAEAVKDVVGGDVELTSTQLTDVVNRYVEGLEATLAGLPESDFGGRTAQTRTAIRSIRQAVRATPEGASEGVTDQLASLQRLLAQQEFDRLEALRKRAQQNASSRAEVASIGRRFLRREINAAVRGGNADLLVAIIGQAGEGAITIAQQAIADARAVAAAAARMRQLAASALPLIAPVAGAIAGQSALGPTVDTLKGVENALGNALTAGNKAGNVYETGSDVPGYEAPETGADRETAAERRAAAAQAAAIRSESPIGQARAELLSARAAMDTAAKGSVEYYNALGQFYSAREGLTNAVLEYRANQALLGIDMTDPLAQARVALQTAQAKLASDKGKSPEIQAADRIEVRNAEAELEATKFQQRLDAVTTADDLGRISHSKYISYLENEKTRLESIKNRTFQQQSQLDQIDGLLQDAASSMNAQFNFGDIKLPTPYQIRRRMEEQFSPVTGNRNNYGDGNDRQTRASVTNVFDIDGADTGKVMALLREALGQTGRTTSTSRSRHTQN